MACHGVWCVKTIGDRGPKQKNYESHQIFFLNTKAVGCRSWCTLTSTISVQFANYINNCFQVGDFVCAHKLM